jgi:hypothetical protein
MFFVLPLRALMPTGLSPAAAVKKLSILFSLWVQGGEQKKTAPRGGGSCDALIRLGA